MSHYLENKTGERRRKVKRTNLLLVVFLVSLLLFSCATKSVPEEKPAVQETTQHVAKTGWELEWAETLAEARKEGKVVLYSTVGPEVRDALMNGFKKRTGLPLEVIAGRGGEISAKLLGERRYGLYIADVYMGGTTTLSKVIKPGGALAPIKPVLFLPEVLDSSLWYNNTLPWLDKDQMMLVLRMMAGGAQSDIAFMRGAINKAELTSWNDLLKPQFKGRMNIQDPTASGKGQSWVHKSIFFFGLDWDYMKALAKQEPFPTRDKRIQIEWVMRGRHLIAINPDSLTLDEFKTAGAPLEDVILKETVDILGGGSSGLALIDRAPHANAAKLFVNWFLSKEGQTIFARSYAIQSAREDTPTDHLDPIKIRKKGIEYPLENEEFHLETAKFDPLIMEIFGPLLK